MFSIKTQKLQKRYVLQRFFSFYWKTIFVVFSKQKNTIFNKNTKIIVKYNAVVLLFCFLIENVIFYNDFSVFIEKASFCFETLSGILRRRKKEKERSVHFTKQMD